MCIREVLEARRCRCARNDGRARRRSGGGAAATSPSPAQSSAARDQAPGRAASSGWSKHSAREELEDELTETRRDLLDSRKAQRRAEQERDEAVEARFTAKTTLEALRLAEACFADRLAVLPSARASAEDSPFRDSGRVFESLALLAFFGRLDGDCAEQGPFGRELGLELTQPHWWTAAHPYWAGRQNSHVGIH